MADRYFVCTAAAALLWLLATAAGCSISSESREPEGPKIAERSRSLLAEGKFDAVLQENQTLLAERKGPLDTALFNIGLVYASSSNPQKDYQKALGSFRTLVSDYPVSSLVPQTQVWIQVLEEQQKLTEEKQKLAEDKRTLTREKEQLAREREKLRYAAEKSRQLDVEIEDRRRKARAK